MDESDEKIKDEKAQRPRDAQKIDQASNFGALRKMSDYYIRCFSSRVG